MASHVDIFFTFSCILCFLEVVFTINSIEDLYQKPDFIPSRRECLRTVEDMGGCCLDPMIKRFTDSLTEGFDECYDLSFDSCDHATCKAIMRGQISEDGSIIMEKVLKHFSDDPQLTETIVNRCTVPDLHRYNVNPQAYSCDMLRLNECISLQAIKACKNWKNEEIDVTCIGVEEHVTKCKPFL